MLPSGDSLSGKQPSQSLSRISKTTRFADTPTQQEGPSHLALTHSMSGIPTGAAAHWMVTRLLVAPSRNAMLLVLLALTIVGLQVSFSGCSHVRDHS